MVDHDLIYFRFTKRYVRRVAHFGDDSSNYSDAVQSSTVCKTYRNNLITHTGFRLSPEHWSPFLRQGDHAAAVGLGARTPRR